MLTLLPTEHKKLLITEYRIRLAATFFAIISIVLPIGITAIMPAYYYQKSVYERKVIDKLDVSKAVISQQGNDIEGTLQSIKQSIEILQTGENKVLEYIRYAIDAKPQGISIRSINSSFLGKTLSLGIQGVAKNRTELLSYQKSLQGLGVFSNIDVPLSNFTKDSSLPFTITATKELE